MAEKVSRSNAERARQLPTVALADSVRPAETGAGAFGGRSLVSASAPPRASDSGCCSRLPIGSPDRSAPHAGLARGGPPQGAPLVDLVRSMCGTPIRRSAAAIRTIETGFTRVCHPKDPSPSARSVAKSTAI